MDKSTSSLNDIIKTIFKRFKMKFVLGVIVGVVLSLIYVHHLTTTEISCNWRKNSSLSY